MKQEAEINCGGVKEKEICEYLRAESPSKVVFK